MNCFRAALLLCCLASCDPMVTIGDPDAGADAGVDAGTTIADGGSDPALGLWGMAGTVTSGGGSSFRANYTATVTLVGAGAYRLQAGNCLVSLSPGAGGLRTATATTSCSPTFLTVTFDDGSPLTLDSMRPIRIDITEATFTAGASTSTLNGRGHAGYADGSLTEIDFAFTGTR